VRSGSTIAVVIPALDEEQAVAFVLARIPAWVDRIIVVDNGSVERTAAVAEAGGATVVIERRRGYGRACLTGITAAGDADVLVFLDADGSSDPDRMDLLVDPILDGRADLVLGSRTLGKVERGAMTLPQRIGNVLAPMLIRWIWGERFTDLGPFRAIHSTALRRVRMDDADFGWTVQMQVRAVRSHLRCLEVPVDASRRKAGRSKISGTVRGVLGASTKILCVILKEWIRPTVCDRAPHGRLAVLAKFPAPGVVKTRLIPRLGANGSADLHSDMVEHTLRVLKRFTERVPVNADAWIAGGSTRAFRERFGASLPVRVQPEGALGARLIVAFDAMLASTSAAVVVGTDCPNLGPDVLWQAFERLRTHDVEIGPATDGGYYLIGLRRPAPALFNGVAWGTSAVLAQTMERASTESLRVALLAPLDDVDRPEDLAVWSNRDEVSLAGKPLPELSVVIPTLNESARIAAVVAAVRRKGVEVIVADGGSADDTAGLAARAGARVVAAPRGRGPQLNAGAVTARSQRLLFLHADTTLPENFVDLVTRCLDREEVAIGAFRFMLDSRSAPLTCVERAVHVRCSLFSTPRGDQALFMRASTFRDLGGFPPIPALEDVDLVHRAKRLGRVVVLPDAAVTSSRRWDEAGVIRTTVVNQACLVGYALGLSPARLAAVRSRWTNPRVTSTCDCPPDTRACRCARHTFHRRASTR
jgi:rSAM/selenodomain-associated transferase 2/rSAM/selenodomain-associated transferase 1